MAVEPIITPIPAKLGFEVQYYQPSSVHFLSTSFNQEYLKTIPTARDPWSVLDQVPGIDVNRINVGGTDSGQQATFVARGGSFFQNIYSYDGIDITPPGGGAPGYP